MATSNYNSPSRNDDDRRPSHPPMPPGRDGSRSPVARTHTQTSRPASMRWFMPITDENSYSTRGQALPGIIQSHSTADLDKLRRRAIATSGGSPSPSQSRDDRAGGRARGNSNSSVHEPDLELGRSRTIDGAGVSPHNQFVYEQQAFPPPPSDFPLMRTSTVTSGVWDRPLDERRSSILFAPQMRSQRLIGNSNPRYRWHQYYQSPAELKKMRKPLRKYYERNNYLIQQYMYIDRLLDSSLPQNLIDEYNDLDIPPTIQEEPSTPTSAPSDPNSPHISTLENKSQSQSQSSSNGTATATSHLASVAPVKVVRTPQNLYRLPTADENTRLLRGADSDSDEESQDYGSSYGADGDAEQGGDAGFRKRLPSKAEVPRLQPEEVSHDSPVVTYAIYLNFGANSILLILKIIVTVLTSSMSVLASLVDAALDFLSTFIVWITTRLITRADMDTEVQHQYPVGRRRLEPIGVLVFSIIMITSFFQVGLEAINRLTTSSHELVRLSPAAIAIMATTVVVKFLCWLSCRLVDNSSVQALAQDAMTDIVFNTFSIIFPLVGYYAGVWWLDPLGGLVLSMYVILAWSMTTRRHIDNLTGCAASKDERNILLYLTMRFAKTIRSIQGLNAYHAGDKINVEVDIVLDEGMSLRDSHDLGESLQYVLESVPGVERAFVHADYRSLNLPTHMRQ